MNERGRTFATLDVVEAHIVVFALDRGIESIERAIRHRSADSVPEGLLGSLASTRALRDRLQKRCDAYRQRAIAG